MRSIRPRTWLCLGVLVLAVGFLHHEVLFQGRVYHGEDAADGYYPSHVAILRALAAGELPTWERGAWCGWPLAVDPYYGLFYPLGVIFALFGAVRGLGVTVALHALGAALAMFWLLRKRALEHGPALFGAVAYGFSSFMVERIRHVIFMQLLVWLPLVLVGVEDFRATRRARGLVLAALATGMALVCGALPLAPFVMLALGAYVLPRLWTPLDGTSPTMTATARSRLGLAAWLLGAAAVGVLLAAAQIVPTLAHLPYSPRSLGVDYSFASSYAWPDARYLGVLVAPDLFGGPQRGAWYGVYNHWEMAGWYSGVLTLVVAPFALARRGGRRAPELVALAGVGLLGIGLAFGDHTPLHRFFFRHVPLYAALRCPTRALVMTLVALPILGAEGLAWLAERPRVDRRLGRRLGLALAAAVALAGVALALGLGRARPALPGVAATRAAFAHMALVLGTGGALVFALVAGVVRPARATAALALVSLVDLLAVSRGYLEPRPADWAAGTERFAAVDWLLGQAPRDRFVSDARGPFRLHNLGMTYGIEGAGGYESVSVWRYVNLLYTLNNGRPYPYAQLRQDLAAGDVRRFDTPLVDLLNLRWYIGTTVPAPGWIERFRPNPAAPPHAVHEPAWDPQLAVYENPHVLPRAFVVHRATVLDDAAQAARLTTLDPRAEALLDAAPVPAPEARPPGQSSWEPARVEVAARHHVRVTSDSPAAGVLVLSEVWYPGWRVTVDGREAPLLRADYAFRGVALPAGRHVVDFTFRSRPVALGLGLSALGALGLGIVTWVGRRRRPVL